MQIVRSHHITSCSFSMKLHLKIYFLHCPKIALNYMYFNLLQFNYYADLVKLGASYNEIIIGFYSCNSFFNCAVIKEVYCTVNRKKKQFMSTLIRFRPFFYMLHTSPHYLSAFLITHDHHYTAQWSSVVVLGRK